MKSKVLLLTGNINPKSTQVLNHHLLKSVKDGTEEVQIWLNSPGGPTRFAFGLFNLMRALPYNIVTYNLYEVGSAANILFLAGKRRFAHKDSVFFFHGLSWNLDQKSSFSREQLDEHANRFGHDHKRYLSIVKSRKAIRGEELENLLRDHQILTAAQAKQREIIEATREPKFPAEAEVYPIEFA